MLVAETLLFEGAQYWGPLRIHNISRQTVRVMAQHSRTGEWAPVAEFTVIHGKLAFTVYGMSQNTGTKGVIEGGDANTSSSGSDPQGAGKIITP